MTMINKQLIGLCVSAGVAAGLLGTTDPAQAQATVSCDAAGSGCEQFVPDATNDGTTTVSSSLLVASNQVCVEDAADAVTATIDIDHTWVGDLVITLEPPTGTPTATLLNRLGNSRMPTVTGGCEGNPAQVSFGDKGAVQSCFTGELAPNPFFAPTDGSMANLVAGTIDGTWKLKITDAGTGNFGVLQTWSLEFDCDTIEDDIIFKDSFDGPS